MSSIAASPGAVVPLDALRSSATSASRLVPWVSASRRASSNRCPIPASPTSKTHRARVSSRSSLAEAALRWCSANSESERTACPFGPRGSGANSRLPRESVRSASWKFRQRASQ